MGQLSLDPVDQRLERGGRAGAQSSFAGPNGLRLVGWIGRGGNGGARRLGYRHRDGWVGDLPGGDERDRRAEADGRSGVAHPHRPDLAGAGHGRTDDPHGRRRGSPAERDRRKRSPGRGDRRSQRPENRLCRRARSRCPEGCADRGLGAQPGPLAGHGRRVRRRGKGAAGRGRCAGRGQDGRRCVGADRSAGRRMSAYRVQGRARRLPGHHSARRHRPNA